ncbi:SAM-dependent methyltransferase [Streptomyces sp. NPDC020141]|uniref:SAM-dependent methyltransferase n=1 Tax=Streptomyces sp. NPDC020141 TaxID=3365065 RepID=UPI00378A6647
MNGNTEGRADEGTAPPAAGVGGLYDRNTELVDGAADGNIHFGYWEDESDSGSFPEATDRLTDLVAERVRAAPGRRVLDVGCGTGRPALRLAAASGARVTGVSVSHQEIGLARARAERSGLGDRARFTFADAMDLPFDDATFDAAWAIESLTHMADRTEALREIGRTLRPGGRVVISDFLLRRPVTGAGKEIVDHMCRVFQAPSVAGPDEHWNSVRRAGFEVVEFLDIGENVRRSYIEIPEFLNRAGASVEEGADIEFLTSADSFSQAAALPEVGYVLMVAERPAR